MRKSQADYQRTYRKKHPLSGQCSMANHKAKQLCLTGRVTCKQLEELFERYGYKCFYCSVELTRGVQWRPQPDNLTIDHLTPLSKGGGNSIRNIVPSCRACNALKGREISLWCRDCNLDNRMEKLMEKVRQKRALEYTLNLRQKALLERA